MIKIIIVDDHQMFIDGVKSFFENDTRIEVLGAATNGADAFKLLQKITPDIILLDVHLPQMDGEKIMEQIRRKYPKLKILAVTFSAERRDIQRMLHNGANGYMLKDKGKEELINAVHQVYSGTRYIPLELLDKAMPNSKTTKAVLTKRELEVLGFLKEGYSDQKIADTLNVAKSTVETHLRNMRKKTKTKNRIQLVNYAVEYDLI